MDVDPPDLYRDVSTPDDDGGQSND